MVEDGESEPRRGCRAGAWSAATRRSGCCAAPGRAPRTKAAARSCWSRASPELARPRWWRRLRADVRAEGLPRIAFRCSPYHTNSALYPVIEHVRRLLRWQPEDRAETRLEKLEAMLGGYSQPLDEIVPLFASLLSLPLPETGVSAPRPEPTAAQAADPGRADRLDLGGGRAAAHAGGLGGPALGRSVDAGVSRAAARAGADGRRSCWCSPFGRISCRPGRTARTSPRSRSTRLERPQTECPCRGAGRRQDAAGRGDRAYRCQDRWRAALRRGADQDDPRVRASLRRGPIGSL